MGTKKSLTPDEIEWLRLAVEEIQRELRELIALLQSRMGEAAGG